ncbi:hypothetical protein LZ30DRAFT_38762 [Colletotrichum cereale]|nr:hypothetical protein LZ30DRAFT_38762 [Colletotrichum cereale]
MRDSLNRLYEWAVAGFVSKFSGWGWLGLGVVAEPWVFSSPSQMRTQRIRLWIRFGDFMSTWAVYFEYIDSHKGWWM